MKKQIKWMPIVLLFLLSINYLFAQENFGSSATQRKYQQNEILYQVSVVGHVDKPDTYEVLPGTRISQVFNKSFTESSRLIPSSRNIELKRDDKIIHLDLLKFFRLGDESNNPYLEDGDIVVVHPVEETVTISGAVNIDGTYELISGDRLLDIIELSMGVIPRAYLNEAEIVRFTGEHDSTRTIDIKLSSVLNNPKSPDNILLEDDDRIYIRSIPEFHRKKGVDIRGEVKFPGYYAIKEGETRLMDIINAAGGPTKFADLDNAYLQRRRGEDIIDPEFERLKKVPVEEMTDMEYEYFKTKSREMRGKFAIDFEHLMADIAFEYNVLLKNRDYIYFPDKSKTVYVSGSVKNPGLVTYVEGRNYKYYLEEAGGFAWRARKGKIRVIKANTREWLEPDEETKIEIGDMIFVPEKPEYDYWQIAKDVLAALGEVATVLIVIQNIK